MAPGLSLAAGTELDRDEYDDQQSESKYQKGVKYLCDMISSNGNMNITVPKKYILPVAERPNLREALDDHFDATSTNLNLPVIDCAELNGPNRSQVIRSVAKACEEYGIFQLVNHGISTDVIQSMMDSTRRFFELPFDERAKYMSSDVFKPVRYGTSFNQSKDKVFCWRDFLKLNCTPISNALEYWPSSPPDFRQVAVNYGNQTKSLYLMLMGAILESLGLLDEEVNDGNPISKEFEDCSQLMVLNCYPSCPEPDLTLGMPPHSDYGLLTLLLQDEVKGLQIQHQAAGNWLTVQPIPNSFVVNVGDHLEIFSNGKYKSVMHRVLVNYWKPRISIASLHSLPFNSTIRPSPKLIDHETNPRRYKDTDFATFLQYISSCEPKTKNFLESRKLTLYSEPCTSN